MSKNFRQKYIDLKDIFEEATEALTDTLEDNRRINKENYYLTEFISFKDLQDEYEYFKEHAHPAEDPDNPFSHLIL